MDVGCMQFERFYSLYYRIVAWFVHLHNTKDFIQFFQIWDNVCGGKGMSVHPYTHPQHLKVLKHLCIAWMLDTVERFSRPNHSKVAWFAH